MKRRDFLGTMLAACAAPAIVRAGSIMRVRGLIVPRQGLILAADLMPEVYTEPFIEQICEIVQADGTITLITAAEYWQIASRQLREACWPYGYDRIDYRLPSDSRITNIRLRLDGIEELRI